jgi:hypothetical protein
MAALNVPGQSIANFTRDGVFPADEEVSKSYVEGDVLASALQAVAAARAELEVGTMEALSLRSESVKLISTNGLIG